MALKVKPPTLPEVRRCLDAESPWWGATATAGTGSMAGRWLVAHPEQGGHWTAAGAGDADVAGWAPMVDG